MVYILSVQIGKALKMDKAKQEKLFWFYSKKKKNVNTFNLSKNAANFPTLVLLLKSPNENKRTLENKQSK